MEWSHKSLAWTLLSLESSHSIIICFSLTLYSHSEDRRPLKQMCVSVGIYPVMIPLVVYNAFSQWYCWASLLMCMVIASACIRLCYWYPVMQLYLLHPLPAVNKSLKEGGHPIKRNTIKAWYFRLTIAYLSPWWAMVLWYRNEDQT